MVNLVWDPELKKPPASNDSVSNDIVVQLAFAMLCAPFVTRAPIKPIQAGTPLEIPRNVFSAPGANHAGSPEADFNNDPAAPIASKPAVSAAVPYTKSPAAVKIPGTPSTQAGAPATIPSC